MVSVTDRHQLATIFGWWQSFVGGVGGFSELGLSFVAFLAMAFHVEEEGRFKMVGGRASQLEQDSICFSAVFSSIDLIGDMVV